MLSESKTLAIINGTKYTVPLQTSGTHPFYNAGIGAKGNIIFVDQPYFNLTLLYDIYSDELIVQQRRANGVHALIKLYKASVESFRIHDHTFRNYQGEKAQKLGMVSGFYDVLYENSVFTLIAKRKKNTHVDMGMVQYENEDQYFFIQNGKIYAVSWYEKFLSGAWQQGSYFRAQIFCE